MAVKNNNSLDEIELQALIIKWLLEDEYRIDALIVAEQLKLNDWMLAAGFVRNLVWDKIHGLQSALNDIDLIYFDVNDLSIERDKAIEAELKRIAPIYPWSVKNQARMHLRNGHQQYSSSLNAMSYWPEKQTAIGVSSVYLSSVSNPIPASVSGMATQLVLHTPFDFNCLFDLSLHHNPKAKRALFEHRLAQKGWLQTYPKLRDNG